MRVPASILLGRYSPRSGHLFRYGMRAMLDAAPGYEVIGEAATGEAAVAMTAELKPDVVLMDLRHRHSSAPEKPS